MHPSAAGGSARCGPHRSLHRADVFCVLAKAAAIDPGCAHGNADCSCRAGAIAEAFGQGNGSCFTSDSAHVRAGGNACADDTVDFWLGVRSVVAVQ